MTELPNVETITENEALDVIVTRRLEAAARVNAGDYATAVKLVGDTVKWSDVILKHMRPTIALTMQVAALHSDLGTAYAVLGERFRAAHELKRLGDVVRMAAGHCPCGLDSEDGDCPENPCRWGA
ncbi:hypothetical protein [Streptomyces sp. NPDC005507]|uniref:hypothetical protein n=1 Tax=Streptomyces sp. NPDC005507 TaxID=3154885 RepID=UPI0033A2D750